MADAPTQKIRIELEIEATPWTNERIAEDGGFDLSDVEEWGDVPEDIEVHEIAKCIEAHLDFPSTLQEALAGSGLYYDLANVTLIRADQVSA